MGTSESKHVLVITFPSRWLYHFGCELELIQRHLDQGHSVTVLACHGAVRTCEGNRAVDPMVCDMCVSVRSTLMKELSGKVAYHVLDRFVDDEDRNDADEWSRSGATISDFKNLTFDDVDIGWGAISSTVSARRDPDCASTDAVRQIQRFAFAGCVAFRGITRFLAQSTGYDMAYIFNGRFAVTRAAMRACERARICEVIFHERGSTLNRLGLFRNALPHSISALQALIDEGWPAVKDDPETFRAGDDFYHARRAGQMRDWPSFVTGQQAGLLPSDWTTDRTNVVIYTSSEDEFIAIGDEWTSHVYDRQIHGIQRIITDARRTLPACHFTVRIHPNAKDVHSPDLVELLAMQAPNLTVVAPDASVSSYALLDAADVVLSFGSTMGIEATYWGKPSIVAGPAFYQHLDAAYYADSHEAVMKLLSRPLSARPQLDAIKYGWHFATFGTAFRYFEPTALQDGRFGRWQLSTINRELTLRTRLLHACFGPSLRQHRAAVVVCSVVAHMCSLAHQAVLTVRAAVFRTKTSG